MNVIAIYARQSREKETTGSIDDQIFQGEQQALALGFDSKVYVDRGESAAYDTLDNRPQFMKLIRDIESGSVHAVFVYDESRLTRNQTTKLYIKKIFAEYKIKVYTKIDGVIDFEDSDAEFMSDIRTIFASKFVKDSSKKIRGVLRNRAMAGKAHGGLLKPYGYTSDKNKMLVIDEEEARIVREIYGMCISGKGSGKIATILNSRNVATKGSKLRKDGLRIKNKYTNAIKHIPNNKILWVGNTVLTILKNPIYKGERLHKGEVFQAPPIVDSETWDEVQQSIQKNKRLTGPVKHQYLLKGLCECGRCGSNFVGKTRLNKRDHFYYCSSKIGNNKCGIRSLNIDYLDEVVWYAVVNSSTITDLALKEIEKLQNPVHISELKLGRKSIENQIKTEEVSRAKIIDLYKRDVIGIEEAETDLNKSSELIKSLNEKLNSILTQLDNHELLSENINETVEFQKQLKSIAETSNIELKKMLVHMFIERIYINFDDAEERYSIEFLVKFPNHKELHHFFLDKGVEPNLLNYDIEKDKYLNKNYKKKSTGGLSNLLVPKSTLQAMSPWSGGAHIPSRERYHWRITAYYFWMNCQNLNAQFWK